MCLYESFLFMLVAIIHSQRANNYYFSFELDDDYIMMCFALGGVGGGGGGVGFWLEMRIHKVFLSSRNPVSDHFLTNHKY